MSCRLPPPIADRDLLAYLDGEAKEEVATHLAQCPYCRQRADQMASWQQELTARLQDEAAGVGGHLFTPHLFTPALSASEAHWVERILNDWKTT